MQRLIIRGTLALILSVAAWIGAVAGFATPANAATLGGKTDLIGRNSSNKDLYLYRGDGNGGFAAAGYVVGNDWGNFDTIFSAGDFDRDLKNDVIARHATTKDLYLYRGNGNGGFAGSHIIGDNWGNFDIIFSAGDFNSDGMNDVIARHATTKDLYLYRGNGGYGFLGSTVIGTSWGNFDAIFSAGDFDRDGRADVIARNSTSKDLYLYRGNGSYGFLGSKLIGDNWANFDRLLSAGDFDRDGRADVIGRHTSTKNLYLYRGNGSDGFLGSEVIGTGWGNFDIIFSPGDFDKDGIPNRADTLTRPVYFVHGYTDDGAGFNAKGAYWYEAIADYYNDGSPANLSSGKAWTWCYYSADTNCDLKVPGDRSKPIKELGMDLAWEIYDHFSRHGVAVDVVAHSMGGLVIRAALTGVQKSEAGFPPYLFVEDVTTLSTPHRGAPAGYLCTVVNANRQCQDMAPGSQFLSWLVDNAQSSTGTDWTVIGFDDDLTVPVWSAVPDNMTTVGHRVIYDGDQILPKSYAHMELLERTTGAYSYWFCDYFNSSCASSGRGTFPHVTGAFDPIKMSRYAVHQQSLY